MSKKYKRITVRKASGETQPFDRDKLMGSLIGSGTRPEIAEDVFRKVAPSLKPNVTSAEIFRLTNSHLRSCDMLSKMRYSLKKAIFALGPSGYPFEQYVARVLTTDGYSTKVGVNVRGKCIEHEVDIVAKKGNTVCFVECKFHTNGGVYSDVKTALYICARFQDIRNVMKSKRLGAMRTVHYGMLITNTRFSPDAVNFARCTGLRAIGWKYPKKNSLEQLIDRHKVYPVTVLPQVKGRLFNNLAGNGIIAVNDLADMSVKRLASMTGLEHKAASTLLARSAGLCDSPR